MNAEKLAKWRRWIEKLTQEVTRLHHDRRIWREMMKALDSGVAAPFFQAHYTRLYADRTVIAVRRLVYGSDARSICLNRLLEEISASPGQLNGSRHAELFRSTVFGAEYGAERFDDEWGDGTGNLDLARLDADLDRLRRATEQIKRFADRTVAHLDQRGYSGTISFADLDLAVDAIGDIVGRYQELITGSSAHNWEPTVQGDWKAPFRTPLFGGDFP